MLPEPKLVVDRLKIWFKIRSWFSLNFNAQKYIIQGIIFKLNIKVAKYISLERKQNILEIWCEMIKPFLQWLGEKSFFYVFFKDKKVRVGIHGKWYKWLFVSKCKQRCRNSTLKINTTKIEKANFCAFKLSLKYHSGLPELLAQLTPHVNLATLPFFLNLSCEYTVSIGSPTMLS